LNLGYGQKERTIKFDTLRLLLIRTKATVTQEFRKLICRITSLLRKRGDYIAYVYRYIFHHDFLMKIQLLAIVSGAYLQIQFHMATLYK